MYQIDSYDGTDLSSMIFNGAFILNHEIEFSTCEHFQECSFRYISISNILSCVFFSLMEHFYSLF